MDAPATQRSRRLTRAVDDRLVGGVAAGLAEHLRLPVLAVRVAFVVLTALGGAGLMMYGALWFLTPEESAPPGRRRRADRRQLAALAAITGGVFSLVSQFGLAGRFLWPGVAAALGIGLVWQQADSAQRHRWRSVATGSASFWVALLRFVVGAALIALGLVGFLATQGQLARARAGLLSTAVVVAGLVLLAGPWVARLARDLGAERRARIRAQERAEVAAQVHDSVLHTLALIQRNAADPHTVGRLARAEERSLRNWLYQRNGKADAHLRNALERLAGEVEELHGVPVNLVAVGDARLDDRLLALVQATREAVVNAAKSSGANSVSVYAETERDRATVFVRDRGCGFDPAEVPADRHGISGSIVGRMTRSGGTALVRSVPGEGTEVELAMPLGARRANR